MPDLYTRFFPRFLGGNLVARIRVDASKAGIRKDWNSACEEFLRHCRIRNLSPHTAEYYREDLRYTQEILKLQYADELTKDKVDELVLHEMDKGNKVTAINSRLRGLRVFVHFCAEREYMDDFKYPLLKVDQEQKEPYTDEELRKLLKRPRTQSWNEWRCWAAVNMLLATGIRANTLVNMRVGDVDFKENTIFLQKLKNRKQQTLPLSSALRGVLQTYLKLWKWEKDTYLFPTYTNGIMRVSGLQGAIRRYNLDRGVSKTSVHLFRHTFAKNYILAGGGMVQLQAILGHSTLDMTRKYVNLYGQDIVRDFDKLNPLNNILKGN